MPFALPLDIGGRSTARALIIPGSLRGGGRDAQQAFLNPADFPGSGDVS